MNNLMVGRELKMEELRKEVRRLRAAVEKAGRKPPVQRRRGEGFRVKKREMERASGA